MSVENIQKIVKARLGRYGSRHVLCVIDEADNEFLRDFLGSRVVVHMREINMSTRARLVLNKTFRRPRGNDVPTKCPRSNMVQVLR